MLAGGAARRLGGAKVTALLGGRPLIAYPLAALRAAGLEAVVVAKPDTALPPASVLGHAAVWREPEQPRHPLAGIVWALERAQGRAVVVCPVDLPFVDAGLLSALLAAGRVGQVAVAAGQPLLGRFPAGVREALAAAGAAGDPAGATIASLQPVTVAVSDPARTLFNVNTPAQLAAAEAMIGA